MKIRFKPTGEIIEIDAHCGQPIICTSIPPKYRIKDTGAFVLCSDCEMVELTSPRAPLHYDQIANFQVKSADSPAVVELNEKVMEALSHMRKDNPDK